MRYLTELFRSLGMALLLVCLSTTLFAQQYNKDIIWETVTGMQILQDGTVRKSAQDGWGNSGYISRNVLNLGDSGTVELSLNTNLTKQKIVGFSSSFENFDFKKIEYGFFIDNGRLYAYEKGYSKHNFGTVQAGMHLKIRKDVNDKVYFYINNQLKYTSSTPVTKPLRLVGGLYANGHGIESMTIDFYTTEDSRKEIFWDHHYGLCYDDNARLAKCSDRNGKAGVFTKNTLKAGNAGSIGFVINDPLLEKAVGLATSNRELIWHEMHYNFYLKNGAISFREKGSNKANLGTVVQGDEVKIVKDPGGWVRCYINGKFQYTSTDNADDVDLFGTGILVTDSDYFEDYWVDFDPEEEWYTTTSMEEVTGDVQWLNIYNYSNDDLFDWSNPDSEQAFAVSQNKLKGGNIATLIIDPNKLFLKHGKTDTYIGVNTYDENLATSSTVDKSKILYGFYLEKNLDRTTSAFVFENGVKVKDLGTFEQYDKLKVEISGNQVRYFIDSQGLLPLHTSQKAVNTDVTIYQCPGTALGPLVDVSTTGSFSASQYVKYNLHRIGEKLADQEEYNSRLNSFLANGTANLSHRIQWKNLRNVFVDGKVPVDQTSMEPNEWTYRAVGESIISFNKRNSFDVTIPMPRSSNGFREIGFKKVASSANGNKMEIGFHMDNSVIKIKELSTYKTMLDGKSSIPLYKNTDLAFKLSNGTVDLLVDGVTVYSYAMPDVQLNMMFSWTWGTIPTPVLTPPAGNPLTMVPVFPSSGGIVFPPIQTSFSVGCDVSYLSSTPYLTLTDPGNYYIRFVNLNTGEIQYHSSSPLSLTGAVTIISPFSLKPGLYRYEIKDPSGFIHKGHFDVHQPAHWEDVFAVADFDEAAYIAPTPESNLTFSGPGTSRAENVLNNGQSGGIVIPMNDGNNTIADFSAKFTNAIGTNTFAEVKVTPAYGGDGRTVSLTAGGSTTTVNIAPTVMPEDLRLYAVYNVSSGGYKFEVISKKFQSHDRILPTAGASLPTVVTSDDLYYRLINNEPGSNSYNLAGATFCSPTVEVGNETVGPIIDFLYSNKYDCDCFSAFEILTIDVQDVPDITYDWKFALYYNNELISDVISGSGPDYKISVCNPSLPNDKTTTEAIDAGLNLWVPGIYELRIYNDIGTQVYSENFEIDPLGVVNDGVVEQFPYYTHCFDRETEDFSCLMFSEGEIDIRSSEFMNESLEAIHASIDLSGSPVGTPTETEPGFLESTPFGCYIYNIISITGPNPNQPSAMEPVKLLYENKWQYHENSLVSTEYHEGSEYNLKSFFGEGVARSRNSLIQDESGFFRYRHIFKDFHGFLGFVDYENSLSGNYLAHFNVNALDGTIQAICGTEGGLSGDLASPQPFDPFDFCEISKNKEGDNIRIKFKVYKRYSNEVITAERLITDSDDDYDQYFGVDYSIRANINVLIPPTGEDMTEKNKVGKINASFCGGDEIPVYYAFMSRTLTGGRHQVESQPSFTSTLVLNGQGDYCAEMVDPGTYPKTLKFQFDEDYFILDDKPLDYKIFNYSYTQEILSVTTPIINVGDNRFNLNVSELVPTESPFYILEVWNSKNESRYLRFTL